MARKVSIDFTGVESYSKAAEGIHTAKVATIDEKTSQAGDPMLQFAFEVIKGDSTGARVFESFVLKDNALWKFKAFLQAIGMQANGKLKLDLDKLIGKVCDIEVFHEEYNGQVRAKISDYYKTASSVSDDDEDEDDEDEDDEEEEAPKKAPAKRGRKKKEPEPEPDEDEEDDEEEEDEEPTPKKSKKSAPKKAKKKPEPEPEEDEDDDDDDDWEDDD
jgi:hypothetical protein